MTTCCLAFRALTIAVSISLIAIGSSRAFGAQPRTVNADTLRTQLEDAAQAFRAGSLATADSLFSRVIDTLEALGTETSAIEGDMLGRALYYRAQVAFAMERASDAERDVERLLWRAPTTRVDRSLVDEAFAALFDDVRTRRMTEVEIVTIPRSASVIIDGRPSAIGQPLTVRPGRHVVEATLAGYQPVRREIDVPAGGRVRLDLQLEKMPVIADDAELEVPRTWTVWHLHRASSCAGRLSLVGERLRYHTADDGHAWEVPLSQVQRVAGNRSIAGGLEHSGSFHVRLADGRNYNFTLDAPRIVGMPRKVPVGQGKQVVAILQSAVEQYRRR